MPRKPVDYSKTVIYKLVYNNIEVKDIYVGSTSNFRNRKNQHKKQCNNEKAKAYKLKVYQTIRENGGWENYSMIEIEKFSCKDGNEARTRERYWYEELEAKLNMRVPNRSQKEFMKKYKVEHREEIKEYIKKYEAEHREEQTQKMREYRANHPEQKEYKKKYDEEHREEINRKARERYAKKKAEKILISSV